jgi:error-prone DNA polymerase
MSLFAGHRSTNLRVNEVPENPLKIRPHPAKHAAAATSQRPRAPVDYAELAVTSNFTFLTGASHPDELVAQAAALGCRAVAIADTNTLAGIVRAHAGAIEADIQLVVGCRLALADPPGIEVLVYPTDLASYGRLCTLLTAGKRRAEKGDCQLALADLLENNAGLLAAAIAPPTLDEPAFAAALAQLREAFDDDRLSLAAACPYGQDDQGRLDAIAALARRFRTPLLATNDAHYHVPARRPLQDVITCIRHGCTLAEAGKRLLPNAERHLKSPAEMARLFAAHPRAIARSVEIARRAAGFSLDQLRYQYPQEVCPPCTAPMDHLRTLTAAGARQRYPQGIPARVQKQIDHELALIDELGYPQYFLTVHDLVNFARSRRILCQGRGAAANSAVCFCLGVTSVDPDRIDVLFERFISRERDEPPDIDIDFEHERREEVIQYIYAKYGRHRAALTAEVITYRGRLAVREVGAVLGLSDDCVDRLAKSQDWWATKPVSDELFAEAGLDAADPTVRAVLALTNELMGFPRHLSQHVGGFVITRDPLCELVPIENASMPDRTVIEWDKDDIDALGMLKVDCLGLGMLTCIRKAFELIERHENRPLTLATIPPEDPAVYDMICKADTVGVFQIESRAQMSMLPRLRPRCFYDLVIEVAIVRPGPIVGDMVHPYLRRRQGIEPVEYPKQEVRDVLGKTLGVPLFQEQAMKLAMVAGGFSPDQADQLRRAIASKRGQVKLEVLGRQLVSGMLANGYPAEFAQKCLQQFHGFSQYGFPESHAASFALLVYASAWIKCHYPAAFAAALLNSQPMGFYGPGQIVADARRHGVEVRPVDVNRSGWDCRLERDARGRWAIRLGMRLVKGVRKADALAIERATAEHGPFGDVASLCMAASIRPGGLEQLAKADAFASMNLDRQAATWQIRAVPSKPMPLFGGAATAEADDQADLLPPVSELQNVVQDYRTTGLSLRRHPMSFLRDSLDARRVKTAEAIRDARRSPHRSWAKLAGVVLVRQRPSSAAGVLFMTLEDETGCANVMVRPSVYERLKKPLSGAIVLCSGRVERAGEVVHLVVSDATDITGEFESLEVRSRNFH